MKVKQILLHIAASQGVCVAEVRDEIQKALDIGWNSSDTEVQAFWRKIPYKHEKPTIEEVISFLAREQKKKQQGTADFYGIRE